LSEFGLRAGEEDGVDNSDVDSSKLYTQPEEVWQVYEALSKVPNGKFTVAAAFGNVHGVYSPGNVRLEPQILHNTQKFISEKLGGDDKKPVYFVFHGSCPRLFLAFAMAYGPYRTPRPHAIAATLTLDAIAAATPPRHRHDARPDAIAPTPSPRRSPRANAGGSGSSTEDIQYAIEAGTIKMNIDTDTQWSFWDGIREYEAANHDYLQAQIGNPDGADKPNKKYYDPRMCLRSAEEATVERLGLVPRLHQLSRRASPIVSRSSRLTGWSAHRQGDGGPQVRQRALNGHVKQRCSPVSRRITSCYMTPDGGVAACHRTPRCRRSTTRHVGGVGGSRLLLACRVGFRVESPSTALGGSRICRGTKKQTVGGLLISRHGTKEQTNKIRS